MTLESLPIGTIFKSTRTWQTYLLLKHGVDDCHCKALRLRCPDVGELGIVHVASELGFEVLQCV